MAIAKKPSSKPLVDASAEKFIAGAGAAPPDTAARGRVATMVRFDAELLDKVDAAAKKRGVSRSAWIQYTLSEALENQQ
jgi:predicted HicB family RNase H-like nuclease